jgi:hypothetical protein
MGKGEVGQMNPTRGGGRNWEGKEKSSVQVTASFHFYLPNRLTVDTERVLM